MAHVIIVIPKGFRMSKRVQTLSCMENDKKEIQQKLDFAAKVKQQLDKDIFEREYRLKPKV